jgi:MFS-type transporter involved in bile tolerance (Atg22 family)
VTASLTGVFTFGGVLGRVVLGLSTKRVIAFGIAANVVAGIATISSGQLDDRLGAKPVIIASLIGRSGRRQPGELEGSARSTPDLRLR